MHGLLVAAIGGALGPAAGFGRVLVQTRFAALIELGQIELCGGVAEIGRLLQRLDASEVPGLDPTGGVAIEADGVGVGRRRRGQGRRGGCGLRVGDRLGGQGLGEDGAANLCAGRFDRRRALHAQGVGDALRQGAGGLLRQQRIAGDRNPHGGGGAGDQQGVGPDRGLATARRDPGGRAGGAEQVAGRRGASQPRPATIFRAGGGAGGGPGLLDQIAGGGARSEQGLGFEVDVIARRGGRAGVGEAGRGIGRRLIVHGLGRFEIIVQVGVVQVGDVEHRGAGRGGDIGFRRAELGWSIRAMDRKRLGDEGRARQGL